MAVHKIPIERLTPDTLRGVIEEFISRSGTDYGEKEASPERSYQQVKHKLEHGLAVLVYDDEAETTNILQADNPSLRTL
jgi:uncharacterized protein